MDRTPQDTLTIIEELDSLRRVLALLVADMVNQNKYGSLLYKKLIEEQVRKIEEKKKELNRLN